ncbi:10205_t:CDS:2, partial [Entrophospora sp. SA101]
MSSSLRVQYPIPKLLRAAAVTLAPIAAPIPVQSIHLFDLEQALKRPSVEATSVLTSSWSRSVDCCGLFPLMSTEKRTAAVEKIKQEIENQNVEFLQLDLQSLKSVKECAESFLARKLPLHILVNNAGIAAT